MVDMKDSYTQGHSFRVAEYTSMLAREMGCDEETRKEILDMCYDAVIEIRSLLAQMKEKREYANEAYLAANEEAGNMISLKEWREKAPPRFDWDR